MVNKLDKFNFLNTNARSLCPKISSLIDNFKELECAMAVITETWLKDSPELDEDLRNLEDGAGILCIHKNRKANHRGVAHGGVCVMARSDTVRLSRLKLHNPGNHEVLAVSAKLRGHEKYFVVVACYMPPSLDSASARECMQYIADLVHEAKRKFDSPWVIVAGDFNQFDVGASLAEHVDLEECLAGATRGSRRIDKVFTNFQKSITEARTIAPLQAEEGSGADSDHRVVFVGLS